MDTCTKITGNVPIDKIMVSKWTKEPSLDFFPICAWETVTATWRGMIYVKIILFICGQGFYYGQKKVSFCPGFLLSVGLWGEESVMGPGETDLKGTCKMHWIPVWKQPQAPTTV